MEEDMNDRLALMTGVGDATGAALARRFVQGGYRVAMIARNAERLAELESKIPGAHSYPCDVADLDRLGVVVDSIVAELGAPHVLVHNAIAATFARIFETSVADLERNFRVNTTSLFFLAQKLAPAMIARGEGAIMVTGNTSSFRGVAVRPAWAPTKAAQRILAQCLSKDLGPKRVHVGYITIDAAIDAPWLTAARAARGERRVEPPADWQYERDEYFAHPDAIAEEVYHIAHQHPSTWSFDHVIRPFAESWTLN
jgi:NAD(P)-dependent dehydrogenase (short-subunit alcohol dehydrogenase family)